jgi:hypothetical protein
MSMSKRMAGDRGALGVPGSNAPALESYGRTSAAVFWVEFVGAAESSRHARPEEEAAGLEGNDIVDFMISCTT